MKEAKHVVLLGLGSENIVLVREPLVNIVRLHCFGCRRYPRPQGGGPVIKVWIQR